MADADDEEARDAVEEEDVDGLGLCRGGHGGVDLGVQAGLDDEAGQRHHDAVPAGED